jgi:AmmeMemoRadiSam system protein B
MGFIRRAQFAGSWYPGSKQSLLKELEQYFADNQFGPGEKPESLHGTKRTIIGGVSPHAGYVYSGTCAAFTYLNLFKEKIPDTVIILGTDHRGYGGIALCKNGEWETPLGNLKIDDELAEKILEKCNIIDDDRSAFLIGEHNIEIQLPFIKYCAKDKEVQIVTIKMTPRINFKTMDKISSDIVSAIQAINKDIIILASSDMSHKSVYSEADLKEFKKIDQKVIDGFIGLNPEQTLEAALNTSVCGPQTITTLLLISKKLNATKGKLLKYYASSEKTGDFGYCVGYFSGVTIREN